MPVAASPATTATHNATPDRTTVRTKNAAMPNTSPVFVSGESKIARPRSANTRPLASTPAASTEPKAMNDVPRPMPRITNNRNQVATPKMAPKASGTVRIEITSKGGTFQSRLAPQRRSSTWVVVARTSARRETEGVVSSRTSARGCVLASGSRRYALVEAQRAALTKIPGLRCRTACLRDRPGHRPEGRPYYPCLQGHSHAAAGAWTEQARECAPGKQMRWCGHRGERRDLSMARKRIARCVCSSLALPAVALALSTPAAEASQRVAQCPDPTILIDDSAANAVTLMCTGQGFPTRSAASIGGLSHARPHAAFAPGGWPQWAGGRYWAPDLEHVGDQYLLYFS